MKKHYFLGTAARFIKRERVFLRKGRGNLRDVEALERFLTHEYDAESAVVMRNGRSAIAAGLKYGLQDNDGEIIINGFTCRAVVQGVEAAGFTPVYADISLENLNFTVESLEKCVGEKTRALIVQNTLGNMVDIKPIEKFCKEHKLVLIEDLAHCVGRFYPDGREAGKVGKIVAFSFGKEKSIDSCGGGAVIFKRKIDTLPNPTGLDSKEELRARLYPTIGYIYRKLSYVKLSGVFMRIMLETGLVRKSADGEVDYTQIGLSGIQAKLALMQLENKKHLANKPLREFAFVKDRVAVLEKLRKAGYYFDGFWYEKPVSPARYYARLNFPEEKCKNAVWASKHIVNFPTYYAEKDLKKAYEIVAEYALEGKNG